MQARAVLIAFVVISSAATVEGHRWRWWQYLRCNWFTWAFKGDYYSSERIPEIRSLVGNCRVDVGRCPVGSCTTKPYSFCPEDGYICPETETRSARCLNRDITYQYVKRCVCCKDKGIVVKGTVVDARTNAPLKKMSIRINGRYVSDSDYNGEFSTTISSSLRSIVVRTVDRYDNYMEAVENEDIALGFRGPITVDLFMVKKADPVQIDSTVATTLSLSDNPLNPSAGFTKVEIPSGAFRMLRGGIYNGQVNTRVTFIDTLSDDEAITPGRFLTPVGSGVEPLITDAIFAFNFQTASGSPLVLTKPVTISMRPGMKVWKLNSNTGNWEDAKNGPGRGKRQLTTDEILDIDPNTWYNIDKIPGAPRCYFKGRVFNETDGTEIVSSNTASFRPQIIAYTYLFQRLRLYSPYTSTPADTCYAVRCPDPADPDETLVGFINMAVTEMISVGNAQVPFIKQLSPRVFSNYAMTIQPALTDVNYTLMANDDNFVHFLSDAAGPFYTDLTTCESSTITEPAFHFFMPEPPSYLPVPAGTEICSARVVFRDQWMFNESLSNSTYFPNVTAISIWEENGNEYFFTDVVQMENFTDGNETFIAICIQYRCSQENESTLVYLDIDIPTVNHTYNRTLSNGTVISNTYTNPAFYCWGPKATGTVTGNSVGNVTVEGSFYAPVDVSANPGYYDSTDCDQETNAQDFAYEFNCGLGKRKK